MAGVVTSNQLEGVAGTLRGLLAGLDPDGVTAREAPEMWTALEDIRRLASGAQVLLARRVDESSAPAEGGLRNGAEWMARVSGGSPSVAYSQMTVSRRLAALPLVAASLGRGDLSVAQAEEIAAAGAADPAAVERLVGLAQVASLGELRDECARVKAAADRDPGKTHEQIRRARRLRSFRDAEGAWRLTGRGTIDAGAELEVVLQAITDEIFEQARADGIHEPRDAYRFDAIIEMARRSWDHMHAGHGPHDDDNIGASNAGTDNGSDVGDGNDAGKAAARTEACAGDGSGSARAPDPTGDPAGSGSSDTAQVDVADATPGVTADPPEPTGLADPASPGAGDGGAAPVGFGGGTAEGAPVVGAPRTRRREAGVNPKTRVVLRVDLEALVRGRVDGEETCGIAGLGPVPVRVARDLLGDATLHLVVTRGVEVANVTYLGRGPNAAQRIALLWTAAQCARLGCHRRAREYDHRDPYANRPETTLDNIDGLCSADHDLKTYDGWALLPGDGKREMVPPTDPRHPGNPTFHKRRTKTKRPAA